MQNVILILLFWYSISILRKEHFFFLGFSIAPPGLGIIIFYKCINPLCI
jgi:hypothetical protein